MKQHIFSNILLLIFITITSSLYSQTTTDQDSTLGSSIDLSELIDISVDATPIQDFLRAIASQTSLNISVDPLLNITISNNFNGVSVKDILLFLESNYDVKIEYQGNIVIVKGVEEKDYSISIELNSKNSVTARLTNVPIDIFVAHFTDSTSVNLMAMPELMGFRLNGFVKNASISQAIENLAAVNNIKVKTENDKFYTLYQDRNDSAVNSMQSYSGKLSMVITNKDSISISTESAKIKDITDQLFGELRIPVNYIGKIDGLVTLDHETIGFDDLLVEIFAGQKSTFISQHDRFWIGDRKLLEMSAVEQIHFQYRAIDSVKQIIPDNLKSGIEIIEYPDMNSLILTGSADRVNKLKEFLISIDKSIPVILIEVIIIENKNSRELSTGITAGIGENPTTTSGTFLSGVDMTLGSDAVNNIIDGLNGFGWVNLGKVTPNFYLTIKALEEDGVIEVESTPQLSTLNGHKATMSIGNTEYYKEEQSNIYGSMTTNTQTITTYKEVEAELGLEIRPIVSGNGEVTMSVIVEQSDFTERISEFAPPGKVSRKFESLIRVKDGEMILLGGLEEKSSSESSSGIPILARIPVIKWLFSSKTRSKGKSKLNIFIKPTILD